jgi:DNA invertase Pin-like site-specific DNA recombinase
VEIPSIRRDRPKLREALGQLQSGDMLMIYKPDRVARSMKELLMLLETSCTPAASTCTS